MNFLSQRPRISRGHRSVRDLAPAKPKLTVCRHVMNLLYAVGYGSRLEQKPNLQECGACFGPPVFCRPSYPLNQTVNRFPPSARQTALLSQVQAIIPLVRIKPLQSGYPTIYISDRCCTFGGQLYLPRPLEFDGIAQSIGNESGKSQFVLGNTGSLYELNFPEGLTVRQQFGQPVRNRLRLADRWWRWPAVPEVQREPPTDHFEAPGGSRGEGTHA